MKKLFTKSVALFITTTMFCFFLLPVVANAAIVQPCNTIILKGQDLKTQVGTAKFADPCNFNALMVLINRVIDFALFYLATPLAAVIFAYAGFLLITSGGSQEKMTKAKHILGNVLIGYVIALAAWLIVNTILNTLGFVGPSYLTQ